jgi:hypothetical protein
MFQISWQKTVCAFALAALLPLVSACSGGPIPTSLKPEASATQRLRNVSSSARGGAFTSADQTSSSVALSILPDGTLRGEVLTAKIVSVHYRVSTCGVKCQWDTNFKASGVATGPYPGTFVAEGGWDGGFAYSSGDFHESFTITSGTRTVSGRVASKPQVDMNPYETHHTFGPVNARGILIYKTGRYGPRPVTTGLIRTGSLKETLF